MSAPVARGPPYLEPPTRAPNVIIWTPQTGLGSVGTPSGSGQAGGGCTRRAAEDAAVSVYPAVPPVLPSNTFYRQPHVPPSAAMPTAAPPIAAPNTTGNRAAVLPATRGVPWRGLLVSEAPVLSVTECMDCFH
eukprot:gene8742-biopygen18152